MQAVQAVTRMNAEQASKDAMRKLLVCFTLLIEAELEIRNES